MDRIGFEAAGYAGQAGASLVVLTDADIYEIYDRRRGHDYDSMLLGRFSLTQFVPADSALCDGPGDCTARFSASPRGQALDECSPRWPRRASAESTRASVNWRAEVCAYGVDQTQHSAR